MDDETNKTKSKYGIIGKLKNGYYRYKFFRRIETNHVLISRNIFSGKNIKVKDGGFAFLCPWMETKSISTMEREIDYKPDVYEDCNGMDLTLDNVITVQVTNAVKYEYTHEKIEEKLKNILDSKLRILIRKYPYEFLAGKNFNLPDKETVRMLNGNLYYRFHETDTGLSGIKITDLKVPEDNSEFLKKELEEKLEENITPEKTEKLKKEYFEKIKISSEKYKKTLELCFERDLASIRYDLNEFEEKYGLSVNQFKCKKINTSEEVRKQQEQLRIESEKVKISKKRAEAMRIEAAGEADKIKILAEANASSNEIVYRKLLSVLKDNNLSPEVQAKILRDFMYSNGSSKEIAGAASAAVMGATAAVTNNQINNEVKSKSM